jgi:hypothetical protein
LRFYFIEFCATVNDVNPACACDAEFASLARMDRKPAFDELRSLSRPVAAYAMRWHENDR